MVNVASASLNQTPMAWDQNLKNIFSAIDECAKDTHILLTPEMSVCGYDMEDMYLSHDAYVRSMKSVMQIIEYLGHKDNNSLNVLVGAPLMMPSGQIYNATFFLNMSGVKGISLKPNLAGEGIHYEERWFKSWPVGKEITLTLREIFGECFKTTKRCTEYFNGNSTVEVPVGDVMFDLSGVLIGIESCEAAFAVNRPAISHYQRGVDLIFNPSASHMAVEPGFDKYDIRQGIINSASRSLGAAYVYANLQGCGGGRSIYDGGNMIASMGEVIAAGPRLSFRPCDVLKATVDIRANRTVRSMHSERIAGGQESAGRVKLEEVSELPFIKPCIDETLERLNGLSAIDKTYNLMSKGISVGLWDWGIKTSIGHYALSLSGGADSALCAVLVYMSHIYAFTELGENEYNKTLKSVGFKEEVHSIEDIVNIIMPKAFVTVYQKTDNNSDKTEGAARALAESIGAEFHSLNIQSIVDSFESVFNDAVATPLSWDNESDDIPLQNLQARTRNPMVWLFANRGNRILMTTSNKSENSVGYCTQDGDTAGVISPIGGVNKSNIVGNDEKPEEQGLLKFLFNRGALLESGEMHKLTGLEQVVSLKPSAELRKLEVSQNDEDDLMPFPILDEIERWHQVSRLAPVEILRRVHQTRQAQYTLEEMGEMVDKYIKLFVRSEWKRNKNAVAFHIESTSLDPKTYARFPLLNGSMRLELQDMWDYIEQSE